MRAEVCRGQPDTFLTLTCRTDTNKTPDDQAQDLVHAFNLLLKRAIKENDRKPQLKPEPAGPRPSDAWIVDHRGQVQRQVRFHPDGLEYFRVLEATANGRPHLHVAMRVDWIDQAWLALQMADLLDSPVVRIERVREVSRIGAYVAKYMGKDPHRFERCKRYTQTKKWQVIARVKHPCFPGLTGRWTREPLSLAAWAAFQAWAGRHVEWLGKDKVKSSDTS